MKAVNLRVGDMLRSEHSIMDDEAIVELRECCHAVAVATLRWERVYAKQDDVNAYRPELAS